MLQTIKTLGFITLSLAGFSAQASDFGPLMKVARNTWPEKTTIGVVCNYSRSAQEVQELALAAGPGTLIQVMDIDRRGQLTEAARRILGASPDYVVLLARDSVVPDYSIEATYLVRFLASRGVPTISTSSVAIEQGAVFAVGQRTQNHLMVCEKPFGTVTVLLPNKQTAEKLLTGDEPTEKTAQIKVAALR